MDIKSIVDLAVSQISEENSITLAEEAVAPTSETNMIEESLELVEEANVKETMAKMANEAIRIVRNRINHDFTEFGPTAKEALIKMMPDIIAAVMKSDTKFLVKIAETSGIAFKYYIQEVLIHISSELITTGTTHVSKEVEKKFNELKKSMGIDQPEETDFEVIDSQPLKR